uniref:Parvovirus non-structural protein 1 helicase domain-containing protein n=1 Tax=Timema genevievae TaxID=629358 RepID=A0A7R9K8D4_TIMGE|nr:unnamed protein product [Timema genevievae]
MDTPGIACSQESIPHETNQQPYTSSIPKIKETPQCDSTKRKKLGKQSVYDQCLEIEKAKLKIFAESDKLKEDSNDEDTNPGLPSIDTALPQTPTNKKPGSSGKGRGLLKKIGRDDCHLDKEAANTADLLLFMDKLFDSVHGNRIHASNGKMLCCAVSGRDDCHLDKEAANTADLLLFMDKLFDSVHGNRIHASNGKMLCCAVSGTSPHLDLWNEAITVLNSFSYIDGNGKKSIPASVKNWVKTLRGLNTGPIPNDDVIKARAYTPTALRYPSILFSRTCVMASKRLAIMNKRNNFSLQEATGKRILLWNEPKYESAYTDTLKWLTGGDSLSVRVKQKKDSHVYKTPLIVPTNNRIGFMYEEAFRDRIKNYTWKAAPFLKEYDKKPNPLVAFEVLVYWKIIEREIVQ